MLELPVIDVSGLIGGGDDEAFDIARQIDAACRENGFFVITGHGIDTTLQARLDATARCFFAQTDEAKSAVAMHHSGRAWRGWFPLGGELTLGRPDHKEGYYFGAELSADAPKVRAGLPLHGPNLFPTEPEDLRPAVLDWMEAMTGLAGRLMEGIALGLGLDRGWFARELTADPTILMRIFRYPPDNASNQTDHIDGTAQVDPTEQADGTERWGVAEHTDYGLLTILAQDSSGGLQVRGPDGWIDVPPLADSFVCNIGDMLDRMTGGRYRSTPHRVLANRADRLSFPFFFDPGWDVVVSPLPLDGEPPTDDAMTRWDSASVHHHHGTYGDYLTSKVARVFPDLFADVDSDKT